MESGEKKKHLGYTLSKCTCIMLFYRPQYKQKYQNDPQSQSNIEGETVICRKTTLRQPLLLAILEHSDSKQILNFKTY